MGTKNSLPALILNSSLLHLQRKKDSKATHPSKHKGSFPTVKQKRTHTKYSLEAKNICKNIYKRYKTNKSKAAKGQQELVFNRHIICKEKF
jgi:hypothetical protein